MQYAKNNELNARTCLFANVIDLQTLTVRFEPIISTSQKSMSKGYCHKGLQSQYTEKRERFP